MQTTYVPESIYDANHFGTSCGFRGIVTTFNRKFILRVCISCDLNLKKDSNNGITIQADLSVQIMDTVVTLGNAIQIWEKTTNKEFMAIDHREAWKCFWLFRFWIVVRMRKRSMSYCALKSDIYSSTKEPSKNYNSLKQHTSVYNLMMFILIYRYVEKKFFRYGVELAWSLWNRFMQLLLHSYFSHSKQRRNSWNTALDDKNDIV